MDSLNFDVVIIGAGAAGLMAAIEAGKKAKSVLLLEATNKIGEKIRISGGGRCNFTNLNAGPNNYLSQNPHFVKSALSQYNQHDFIKMVEAYKIAYHEKTLGQLFCDGSSSQIIEMLVNESKKYNVAISLSTQVSSITKDDIFYISTERAIYRAKSLIIATGGLSIPKIGASSFGYDVAKQFNINVTPTFPALVPLTVPANQLEFFKALSGISIDAQVSHNKNSFRENILFTHRGLSGPAILQISSYLAGSEKKEMEINFLPDHDISQQILKNASSKMLIKNYFKEFLPGRFIESYLESDKRFIDLSKNDKITLTNKLEKFKVIISGCEGYAKAEVTKGGIDTKELSSKTMQANKVPGLYFIGEVVDVTGWLGGYNFQWAWSSGFVAGNNA